MRDDHWCTPHSAHASQLVPHVCMVRAADTDLLGPRVCVCVCVCWHVQVMASQNIANDVQETELAAGFYKVHTHIHAHTNTRYYMCNAS